MKVIAAKVDWMEGWANLPHLQLLLSENPKIEDLVYEERNDTYLALQDGYASFFYYTSPGDGYGGRHFHLKMKDGSEKTLIGPWSSNSNWVGKNFGIELMTGSYTSKVEVWKKGYTFYAGAFTVDFVKEFVLPIIHANQDPRIELIKSRGFYTFGIHSKYISGRRIPGKFVPGWYKPLPYDEKEGQQNFTLVAAEGVNDEISKCAELSMDQNRVI